LATLNGHLRPAHPPAQYEVAVEPSEHRWDTVDARGIAVRHPFDTRTLAYERKPAVFWQVSLAAARASLKLLFGYPAMRQRWAQRMPELTTVGYWRRYLGLDA
jgi:hypothetical protein